MFDDEEFMRDHFANNGEIVMSFAENAYAFFGIMAMAERCLGELIERAVEPDEIKAVEMMQHVINTHMVEACEPIMESVTSALTTMYPDDEF